MEARFEACLAPEAGDRINRVSASAEFVAVLAGYLTLHVLQTRERSRKLAELEAEQRRDVTAP